MSEPERRTSLTFVFAAAILLVAGATLLFAPMLECPLIPIDLYVVKKGMDPARVRSEHSCDFCHGRGRISFFKLWALRLNFN